MGKRILPKANLERSQKGRRILKEIINSTKTINGDFAFNSGKQKQVSTTETANSFSLPEDTEIVDPENNSNKDGTQLGSWTLLGTTGHAAAKSPTRDS